MNLILLLVLVSFMVICNGCKKELKNDHGLKRHRISCHASKAHTAVLLQQRQQLQRSIKKAHGIGKQDDGSLLGPLVDNVSGRCQYILGILKNSGNRDGRR